MKRIAAIAVLAVAVLLTGNVAQADSPVITASGGQCEAKWLSSPNQFRIRDNDLADSDYCYVDWGWSSGSLTSRFSNPQDVGGYFYYTVNVSGHSTIWWKVCKERQNDPDICSSVRSDAT